VEKTIETIKSKDINLWLLSNDSSENSMILGLQSKIIENSKKVYKMLKVSEFMQIQNNLNELDSKQDYSLLID
jgi:hypothetical protein